MVMGEILKKIDALGGIITEAGIKYASRLVLLLILLSTAGCNRRSSVDEKMDLADSLMMSKPDSALVVLENIPASSVKGKEAAARYALLKSIALDKNCIDTTTFDVLQPAIDYYIKNGSPNEQLRTYYYQGRIYYSLPPHLQNTEYQLNKKSYVKLLPLVENFICCNFAAV